MFAAPFNVIDLTYTLSSDNPTWSGEVDFNHKMAQDYLAEGKYKFRKNNIEMAEGCGTHIDAPAHCIPGGKTIEQIPIEDLFAPCVVVDVSSNAVDDYMVSVADITAFEKQHGEISPRSFVIIRTGWDRFWNNPDQYRNNIMFPCVSAEAAQLLVDRGIVGLGVDTLSPDRNDHGFEVHNIVLGADKYLVENIANTDQMPAKGSHILIAPIKTKNGTEAPARVTAFVPKGPQ